MESHLGRQVNRSQYPRNDEFTDNEFTGIHIHSDPPKLFEFVAFSDSSLSSEKGTDDWEAVANSSSVVRRRSFRLTASNKSSIRHERVKAALVIKCASNFCRTPLAIQQKLGGDRKLDFQSRNSEGSM